MSGKTTPAAQKKTHAVTHGRRRWIPWILLAAGAVIVLAGFYGLWRLERYSQRLEALTLVTKGKYAEAEPLLKQALESNPDDVEVVKGLVKVYRNTKRLAVESEPYLNRWCELAPNDPDAFRARLDLWLLLKNREKALKDARRLLEMDPADVNLRATVASLLLFLGKAAEAEKQILICRAAAPQDRDIQFLLAKIYHVQGRKEKTDTVLQDLLRADPRHGKALLLKGERLWEDKKYEQAIPVLRQVLKDKTLGFKLQKARYFLSQALRFTGNTKEAEKVLQQNRQTEAVEQLVQDSDQQPDNVSLYIKSVKALFDAGLDKRAAERLQKLQKLHPDNKAVRRLFEDYNK